MKPSYVFAEEATIDHCLSLIFVNVKESYILKTNRIKKKKKK